MSGSVYYCLAKEERKMPAYGETLKLHGHSADTRHIGTLSERSLMTRGRKTSFTIRLTPAQQQTLLTWQRATTVPAGLARRARILLLLADGVTITDIAATVGLSRRHTYKWIQRFVQEGLEGLHDKPRHDRRIGPLPPDLREQPNNLERG
jgi:CRP-like cAMP-binding protein